MAPPPIPLSTFVGRQAELDRGRELLGQRRLVTLTGPGGAGKTRLALELTREGAIAFCDISTAHDPDGLQAAVAAALDVPSAPGGTGREHILRKLHDGAGVLVVDNCEQVIDPAAELVESVLQECPGVRVLATSQEPLNLPGEALLRLGSLPAEEAAALFRDRLGEEASEPIVARICERLDGIPLAVELAAARGRTMALEDLAAGLEDRFELLVAGSRRAPTRQQTLEAAVEWSYSLLSPEEQAVFNRVAVLPGVFALDAARVAAAGGTVSERAVPLLLSRLGERSLLEVAEGGRGYRMVETLRFYGRERLEEAGEAAQVVVRAAEHYDRASDHRAAVALAMEAMRLVPEDDPERIAILDLAAKEAERTGRYELGVRALEELGRRPEAQADRSLYANTQMRLASAYSLQTGDMSKAAPPAERAKAAFAELGERASELQVEVELAWLEGLDGRAAVQAERALKVVEEARGLPGAEETYLHALGCAGAAAGFTNQAGLSRDLIEEGLALARSRNDSYQVGWFIGMLAHTRLILEGPREPLRLLRVNREEVRRHLDPVYLEAIVNSLFLAGEPRELLAELEAEEAAVLGFGIRGAYLFAVGAAASAELGQAAQAEDMLATADRMFGGRHIYYQSRARIWMAGVAEWLQGRPAPGASAMLSAGDMLLAIGIRPFAALAFRDAADAAWDAGAEDLEREASQRLATIGIENPLVSALQALGTPAGTAALGELGCLSLRARSLEREGHLEEAAAAYEELGLLVRRERVLGRAARAGRAPSSPLARRLRRLVAFEGVPEGDLEALAAQAAPAVYAPGQSIFHEGEDAGALFALDSGRVRLEVAGAGSAADVGPGELLGERSLLAGEHHVVAAKAVEPVALVRMAPGAVLEVARRHPQVAERLVALVSQRVRQEGSLSGLAPPADVGGRLLGAVVATEGEGETPPAFEVLPVYLSAGSLWLLRPAREDSWLVDAAAGRLPEKVVGSALEAAGFAAEIVHSTSWRHQDGRLVLTYLAILPGHSEPPGFEALRVERADLARGSAKGAPEGIRVAQVVEHGLRHLSWLSRDDPVIRAELSPEWLEVVAGYQPEPFRAL